RSSILRKSTAAHRPCCRPPPPLHPALARHRPSSLLTPDGPRRPSPLGSPAAGEQKDAAMEMCRPGGGPANKTPASGSNTEAGARSTIDKSAPTISRQPLAQPGAPLDGGAMASSGRRELLLLHRARTLMWQCALDGQSRQMHGDPRSARIYMDIVMIMPNLKARFVSSSWRNRLPRRMKRPPQPGWQEPRACGRGDSWSGYLPVHMIVPEHEE
ncbi:unnamed protein product, partial [Urochloa humidicola]